MNTQALQVELNALVAEATKAESRMFALSRNGNASQWLVDQATADLTAKTGRIREILTALGR